VAQDNCAFPDLQTVARALGGEVSGGQVRAPGPGHSAIDRSLSIKPDPDAPDGFVCHSFANDNPIVCRDYIREKLNLPPFKPNGRTNGNGGANNDDTFIKAVMRAALAQGCAKPKGKIVATYDYTDADGKLLYQVVRYEPNDKPKYFRQRRPDGNGDWTWNLDDPQYPGSLNGRRVLYRWPELLKFPNATIFVTEGEKDCDRVCSLEHCATTVASGKWTDDCVKALAGRDVFILQDNDDTGRQKAQTAAQALHGTAATIRIVSLPDLPDGGDVSDWLDADLRRADKFCDVCFDAPLWKPEGADNVSASDAEAKSEQQNPEPGEPRSASNLGEWDAGDDVELPPPREWLLGNIFCRRFLSSLLGDGAVGKTATYYAQLISSAIGRSLTGEYVFQRCRVLTVSLEDDKHELQRRILAACIHHNVDRTELKGWLFLSAPGAAGGKLMSLNSKGQPEKGKLAEYLESVITTRKIDIVALDPFVKTHSVEENNNSMMDEVAQILTDLAAKHNIAIAVPHHTTKGSSERGNADKGRGASAIKDAFRLVYTLTTMTPEEAKALGISEEQRKLFIRMDSAKVNITPPMGKAKWFRLVGVRLGNATELYPNGDEVQTVEAWKPPETWADLTNDLVGRILADIDAGLPDGGRYSDGPNAKRRAAWKVVLKHAPKKSEHQAREIIKTWVETGLLVLEEYEDPVDRKCLLGLKIDPTKQPGTTS
jgi:AAA domain